MLGASLVALAQEQGREVVGLYHRHLLNLPGARLLAVDLTDESETRRIFKELKPASVIHCAAQTNVDWCEENPSEAHRSNVTASARLAEITAQLKARFLYVSTDSVFDGNRGNYAENDQPAPLNVYAQTKLQGEREALGRNPLYAFGMIFV